jgi:hypothetical protein
LPNISMETFSMFFRNTLEDAENHLVKFDNVFYIYNVVEYEISFWLFILTLERNACEWFYSFLPGTITSCDAGASSSIFNEATWRTYHHSTCIFKLVLIQRRERHFDVLKVL